MRDANTSDDTAVYTSMSVARRHRLSRLRRMAKPPMRNRAFRVSDELWDAAQAKADQQQENVSDVLRDALERYVRSKPKSGADRSEPRGA